MTLRDQAIQKVTDEMWNEDGYDNIVCANLADLRKNLQEMWDAAFNHGYENAYNYGYQDACRTIRDFVQKEQDTAAWKEME